MSITQIITMYVDENGDEVKKKFSKSNVEIIKNYGDKTVNELFDCFMEEIGFTSDMDSTRLIFKNTKMPSLEIIEKCECISVVINRQEVSPKYYMDSLMDDEGNLTPLKDIEGVEKLKPFTLMVNGRESDIEYDFESFFNILLEEIREAWKLNT